MNMMQILQQLPAAQIIAALVLLPWAAVALMQAVSSAQRYRLDDNFRAHASAALRWADVSPDPQPPVASEALPEFLLYRARIAANARAAQPAAIEEEAA